MLDKKVNKIKNNGILIGQKKYGIKKNTDGFGKKIGGE